MNIVLVAPEIPHNTGAVGRLCVCLGARLHLVRPLGFSLSESQVRRVGLDYWQHVDLHVHDSWEAFLEAVRPNQLVFGSTKGRRSYLHCRYTPGVTLAFGSETRGLPDAFYTRYADSLLGIPMPGPHARSLNLSNAVAIMAYEAYRQIQDGQSNGLLSPAGASG